MRMKVILQAVSVGHCPDYCFFKKKMCLVGLDTYERRAVQLACSRLQELSCKWDGCSVKMNSVDALIRHLNRQHKPSSTSRSNVCLSFSLLIVTIADLNSSSRSYAGGPSVDDDVISMRGIWRNMPFFLYTVHMKVGEVVCLSMVIFKVLFSSRL